MKYIILLLFSIGLNAQTFDFGCDTSTFTEKYAGIYKRYSYSGTDSDGIPYNFLANDLGTIYQLRTDGYSTSGYNGITVELGCHAPWNDVGSRDNILLTKVDGIDTLRTFITHYDTGNTVAYKWFWENDSLRRVFRQQKTTFVPTEEPSFCTEEQLEFQQVLNTARLEISKLAYKQIYQERLDDFEFAAMYSSILSEVADDINELTEEVKSTTPKLEGDWTVLEVSDVNTGLPVESSTTTITFEIDYETSVNIVGKLLGDLDVDVEFWSFYTNFNADSRSDSNTPNYSYWISSYRDYYQNDNGDWVPATFILTRNLTDSDYNTIERLDYRLMKND